MARVQERVAALMQLRVFVEHAEEVFTAPTVDAESTGAEVVPAAGGGGAERPRKKRAQPAKVENVGTEA
jgi:hypothetical protein